MKNSCIAHRGWSGLAPENTLAAFKKTMDTPKIDMIELDVQLSRDGIPVVIHDYTLERTTNGSGDVSSFTLQELKRLDAGSWFSESFADERIPTLEEVFQLVKGNKRLNIEIKRAGDRSSGIEQTIADLVRAYNMESSVIVTSFNHESIRNLLTIAPEIKRGLIIYGMPILLQELLKDTGAAVLSMCYPYLTESFVRPLLDQDLDIIAWTIDQPEHMQQIAKLDERIGICTNHPERWLSL
ncbi:glycerophosphodiester phosphodiesterase [Fodinisporobacter ferrooxydans]|uniref:Glycerophosphodiester phosphodiesterase n=1 Tax=Fodinisporobacter ferrooxydans TaxID=2901836 RepID=A0ABY4CK98_9BACL|nr:glycerophosphodiester phosphodiesterase [Alicyclobacillaceae bacterium MYW30-H2]